MNHRIVLFSLAMLLSFGLGFAQKPFPQKVDLEWEGFTCKIPKNWRYDPYGSSSVCDCAGVIFDNFDDELRINVYFTDEAGLADPMRDEVWDHKWEAGNGETFKYKNANGLSFSGIYGKWQSSEEDPEEVTEVETDAVIRIDGGLNKHQMLRIFVFGPSKEVEKFDKQLHEWLDTIEIKKARRN